MSMPDCLKARSAQTGVENESENLHEEAVSGEHVPRESNLNGPEASSWVNLDGTTATRVNLERAEDTVENSATLRAVAEGEFEDECPLHDDGGYDKEVADDEEVCRFISLAHMCRDEKLFTSYFEELNQQHEQPNDANAEGEAAAKYGVSTNPSSSTSTSGAPQSTKRRKFSPIVQKPNSVDARRSAEEADMLHDGANAGVHDGIDCDEEQGRRSNNIECLPFRLKNELPYWDVGDVFGNRDYLREVVMTK